MPINAGLLQQLAQGRQNPIDSFLPAFASGQKMQMGREKMGMEREQMEQQREQAIFERNQQRRQEAARSAIGELDLGTQEGRTRAAELATRYGIDIKGTGLLSDLGSERDLDIVTERGPDGQNYRIATDKNTGKEIWRREVGDDPKNESLKGYQGGYVARRLGDNGEFIEIDAVFDPNRGVYFDKSDPSRVALGEDWDVSKEASATSADGRFPEGALESKSGRDSATETLGAVQQGQTLISDALNRIDENSTNVGFAGWAKRSVVDLGVSLAEAVGADETAESVHEYFDVKGATELETLADFISANILPVITAENGRFTDKEREMAQRATGILKYGKSAASVKSGLSIIQQVLTMAESRLSEQSGRTSGPSPGQIEDGYEFIGGDPSKMENWRKVGG